MIKKLLFVFLGTLFLHSTKLKAQTKVNYVFAQDSLAGFNEQQAKQIATSKNLVGREFKFYMYKAKREFVNHKYQLNHADNIVWRTLQTASVQPSCSNVDFENATDFFGWTVENGGNSNSLTMAGCCGPGTGVASIISSTGTDPLFPTLSLASPFGGTRIAKLNDATAGNKSQRISQTFNVTSSNAIFQIAYCGLLNSGGHDCFEQPYINISVKDSTGTDLSCPKIEIQAPDPNCTPTSSTSTLGWNATGFNNPASDPNAKVFWHNWEIKTVDLSPYIGSNVTVQITVGDCIFSAHYGYAYFDCRCLPLEISLNGTIFDATPQTPIDVSMCGALNATLIAPLGLNPYLWNGPAGTGVSGVITQSMVTTTPATYTLTMTPDGSCYGPIVKYIVLHASPNPTVSSISAQATCTNATGSGTINIASGTSPFTYNWIPASSTASVATGLTPGTDYTVTVVDTFGCQGITTVSIASFTDAPTYTISPLSANLTCLSTSLTASAITGTNTTAVWTHTTTPNFTVSSPGTYSCVVTNTVSSCTATVPITITTNTVAPVAVYTITCNGSTVSVNGISTAGIALGWLAPTVPPSPVSNPGTSTASGIFTLTATNLTTGCKATYTVESLRADITVATTPTILNLTCITNSIQATTTTTTTVGTTITWSDGTGTYPASIYTITAAGNYTTTVALAGGCSTQSIITVSSNTVAGVNINSAGTEIPCSTNSLTLNASQTTPGSYSYTWTASSPTVTGSVYTVSNAGIYTVTALNATNGCTTAVTQAISHETVTASFVADPYQGLMPLPVSFTNTSTNAIEYYWNLGNNVTDTTMHTSTIYNSQGNYPVILTAINGFCSDTAVRIIKVDLVSFLTIPNVFTPNGDGRNDIFTFNAINIGDIAFTVFDRWGLKMFETTDVGNVKWDGKNKGGSTVTDGTYFYIVKAIGLDGVNYDQQGTINVFQ
ncbi:MAG: gliding motility-associated C-terminal domain-containing protein [Bacteroidota bacterium]